MEDWHNSQIENSLVDLKQGMIALQDFITWLEDRCEDEEILTFLELYWLLFDRYGGEGDNHE